MVPVHAAFFHLEAEIGGRKLMASLKERAKTLDL
jgi:hypothetical protein